MNAKSVKTIRKVERPRPLRSTSIESGVVEFVVPKKSLSDVFPELEALYVSLCNTDFDEKTAENVSRICNILKTYGSDIDSSMKNMLDHYFVTLRNVAREDRLDALSRLKLLEVIELKAMDWCSNENIVNFFKKRTADLLEGNDKVPFSLSHTPSMTSAQGLLADATPINGVPLAPGEVLRSSGKFMNPTKIAGKNYYKDEVVIRNSDSGKVMGIKGRRVHMIEELSDTIISFQRVNPGARDRRVQIAGPNEESISFAKTLVEDTIRRNASPVRERPDDNQNFQANESVNRITNLENQDPPRSNLLTHSMSMGDASQREYAVCVTVMGHSLKIIGKHMEILKAAKTMLMSCFPEPEQSGQHGRPNAHLDSVSKNEFKYPYNTLQRSSSWMGVINNRESVSSPSDTSSEAGSSKDGDVFFKNITNLEEQSAFSYRISDDDSCVPTIPPPRTVYTRDFLMRCAESPLAKYEPQLSMDIQTIYPMMIRNSSVSQLIACNSMSPRPSSDQELGGKGNDSPLI